jgi:hypothetical protein
VRRVDPAKRSHRYHTFCGDRAAGSMRCWSSGRRRRPPAVSAERPVGRYGAVGHERWVRPIIMIGFRGHCPPCGRHFFFAAIDDALGRAPRAIGGAKSAWRSLRCSLLAGRLARVSSGRSEEDAAMSCYWFHCQHVSTTGARCERVTRTDTTCLHWARV